MAILELLGPTGRIVFELSGPIVIGRSEKADLVLDWDGSVSKRHAGLELKAGAWVISDLDSTNGTEVNGSKVLAPHPLSYGDEIRLGDTCLWFHGTVSSEPLTTTNRPAKPPKLTVKQRQVLLELCRPQARDSHEPCAAVKEIAATMFVGEAAVKAHLAPMYDKFEIPEEPRAKRRAILAKRAWDTGAVRRADFETPSEDE